MIERNNSTEITPEPPLKTENISVCRVKIFFLHYDLLPSHLLVYTRLCLCVFHVPTLQTYLLQSEYRKSGTGNGRTAKTSSKQYIRKVK